MCVIVIEKEQVTEEDMVVYKLVRVKNNRFLSLIEPKYRFGQFFDCGTEIEYVLNKIVESSFKTSPGLYTYPNMNEYVRWRSQVYKDRAILKCIVSKGTRFKKCIDDNNRPAILVERLTPVEVIQNLEIKWKQEL